MGPERGARARLLCATVLGVGHAPFAPGTFGSLPALPLCWALAHAGGWVAQIVALLILVVGGTWAAHGAAAQLGLRDPGPVVIDEVAGQLLTLLALPVTGPVLALGFLLFRAFDIVKPPPARQAEFLPGGIGIMADDLCAGAYAHLALRGFLWLFPALGGVSA